MKIIQLKSLYLYCVLALFYASAAVAMSEEEEVKLGAEEHRKIIAAFGVYRNKELQTYVELVGNRVAKESSRAELIFHFTILNDDILNAFALPGGYVYVTRGMLSHMNSESELAAVLGHEIAHITEKHGLRSQTRSKIVGAIATIGAIATGTPGVYELGNLFGGVLLKGYSREFELEADAVGAQYMAKAGYSPEAMLKTIEILKSNDRLEIEHARIEKRAPEVYHGFLSTHPDHDTRYKEAVRESLVLLEDYDEFIRQDEFLEKLNGMTYGDVRQVGVVRKNTFFHPKLGIKITFPEGWRIETTRRGVQAESVTANAIFAVNTGRMNSKLTPKEYLEQKLGMDIREGREVSVSKLKGFLGIVNRADSPFGPRPMRVAVLYDQRKRLVYILSGAGKHDLRNIADDRNFIKTIFSFDLMNRDDRKIAHKPKLQIVRAEAGVTMEELAEESPITNYALDKLRVMNGLYPDGQPEAGQLIKIVD
ncbi:MAG: M48 family metalloprotease [Pseudomonadales bacterium]|nr:M48 family metalloprotease [Pseudomonadales bacterium]